jgi:hypothetical protein
MHELADVSEAWKFCQFRAHRIFAAEDNEPYVRTP